MAAGWDDDGEARRSDAACRPRSWDSSSISLSSWKSRFQSRQSRICGYISFIQRTRAVIYQFGNWAAPPPGSTTRRKGEENTTTKTTTLHQILFTHAAGSSAAVPLPADPILWLFVCQSNLLLFPMNGGLLYSIRSSHHSPLTTRNRHQH